jgi:hypothetical protein
VGSICKFVGLFAVIFFVVVFWQPITALFKFYRDGIYETSSGNKVRLEGNREENCPRLRYIGREGDLLKSK